MMIFERLWCLGEVSEESKCLSDLQEKQQGVSGEVQANQPQLSTQEGGGSNLQGRHFQTYEGQESDLE